MRVSKFYFPCGEMEMPVNFTSEDFRDKFRKAFGVNYNPRIHDHRLDGPASINPDGFENFFIDGIWVTNDKLEYYSRPDVKKYMLLKAIKGLR
jgi:hypothetical protein